MKRWLPFVLPFGAIVAAGVGFKIWSVVTAAPPCDHYEDVTFADLDIESGCVRLSGQAHFEVVVRQTLPGTLVTDEEVLFLFPLFEAGEVNARAIRLMVRTARVPEDLVSFEAMTISGRAVPVTPEAIPFGTEVEIGKRSDYFFTDGMVLLIPDRIVSDGEVWER